MVVNCDQNSMAKADALVSTLRQAEDAQARKKAVRSLKNQIIGNKAKKMQYIKAGAVPTIVSAMTTAQAGSPTDSELLVACAVSIGSFAYGLDAGADAVLQCGGLKALVESVNSSDSGVAEASVRALNAVCSQVGTLSPIISPSYLPGTGDFTHMGCVRRAASSCLQPAA